MTTRIYFITDRENGNGHLIRAKLPNQALAAVVKEQFTVRVANQEDLVRCVGAGITVRDANPAPAETSLVATAVHARASVPAADLTF